MQLVLKQVFLNAKHNKPLNEEHTLSQITSAESVSKVNGNKISALIWKEGEHGKGNIITQECTRIAKKEFYRLMSVNYALWKDRWQQTVLFPVHISTIMLVLHIISLCLQQANRLPSSDKEWGVCFQPIYTSTLVVQIH